MYGCMNGCICMHACMDAWMYGCVDVCMDVWIYAWMHGCICTDV